MRGNGGRVVRLRTFSGFLNRLMLTIVETLNTAVEQYRAGRLPQAEQLCRRVLQKQPRHAGALHLLGLLAHQTGRGGQAVKHIHRALQLNPHYAEAHNSLGMALARQGKLEQAATAYQQALWLKPELAEAHNNLANVFRQQGKLDEAVAGYQRARSLRPGYAEANYNLGVALYEQEKFTEAFDCFEQALRLKPDYAEAHSSLGVAQLQQGRLDMAVASLETALRLRPDIAESHNNLGMGRFEQGRLAEAEASYRQALKLKPDYPGACNNLGVLLADQGRLTESLAFFREALRLNPDFVEVHTNLSYAHYLHGDFAPAWSEYEWRWKCPGNKPPSYSPPYWDGSSLEGKTILLFAEQGLGDSMQFIRYAPLVKERGATVIVQCQPALVRLLRRCPGIDRIIADGDEPPPTDVLIPFMSLPRVFQTTLANIPAPIPYLSADPELRARWGRALRAVEGFKIGIAWQGNPDHNRDRQRSAKLAAFEPLARVPGVRLVSLQKGKGREQLAEHADRLGVLDLSDQVEDYADTAAIVSHLDLVIAVDTSVVHLAGAMGMPVWVALPFLPEWRWLLEREDSPWYPTLRLFRQQSWGDWAGVFERLAASVRTRIASAAG